MFSFRLARRRVPRIAMMLAVVMAACSSADSTGPASAPAPGVALHASWNVTSLNTPLGELVGQGMTVLITFKSDGTYLTAITNDLTGLCGGTATSCVNSGPYTATASTITESPGTVDEQSYTYAIVGNTLTLTTTDGLVTITAVKRV